MKTKNLYVVTVGTGTTTRSNNSDIIHGLVHSITAANPACDLFCLLSSQNADSRTTAELIRDEVARISGNGPQPVSWPGDIPDALPDPDDLIACRSQITALLQSLRQKYPAATLHINPTSGTKPMTAAAILAGVDFGAATIHYTSGTRRDGVVISGTERIQSVPTLHLQELRAVRQALGFFSRGLWEAGRTAISSHLADSSWCGGLDTAAALYDAWDRFEYKAALRARRDFMACAPYAPDPEYVEALAFLSVAQEQCKALSGFHGNDVEQALFRLGDLMANAKRRIDDHRFDDAVSRLYRLLEMFADNRLLRLGINPADTKGTTEALKAHPAQIDLSLYTGPAARIGQQFVWGTRRKYNLLRDLKEPIGADFFRRGGSKWLGVRNDSLLAHGLQPIAAQKASALFKNVRDYLFEHRPEIRAYYRRSMFPRYDRGQWG